MNVKLFQQDIIWGDPEANRRHLDDVLAGASGADLYVFPEMFTTGFATMEEAAVEESEGPVLDWMKARAQQLDAAVAGSVALRNGSRCVNRMLFVTPEGDVTRYDKRHLFNYGGEGERFDPGKQRVIVEFRGVRFMLAICYDLRFPVWLRNRNDYDVLLLVANWPGVRSFAWNTLLQARAIENQCYVLGCNRIGSDPACDYSGNTVIVNPYGEVIATVPDNTEGMASASLDIKALRAYNLSFPVLESADRFTLEG